MNSEKNYPPVCTYLSALRPENLVPKMSVGSILDLTPESLPKGIEVLLLDIDLTLLPHNGTQLAPEVREKVMELAKHYRVGLLSNNPLDRRAIAEDLCLPLVSSQVRKPSRRPIIEASVEFGVPLTKMAIIGDRLLTDIAAGNRAGIYTVKVNPYQPGSEPRLNRIARACEGFLHDFYTE